METEVALDGVFKMPVYRMDVAGYELVRSSRQHGLGILVHFIS